LPSDLAKRITAAEGTGVEGFENTFDSSELFGSLFRRGNFSEFS